MKTTLTRQDIRNHAIALEELETWEKVLKGLEDVYQAGQIEIKHKEGSLTVKLDPKYRMDRKGDRVRDIVAKHVQQMIKQVIAHLAAQLPIETSGSEDEADFDF